MGNYAYYLEWRTQFDALGAAPGVMVYFAPTYGTSYCNGADNACNYGGNGVGGVVGPTNVVHVFDAGTDNNWMHSDTSAPAELFDVLADAFVPEGQTYFVDLSEVGLGVTVDR